ncbi:PilZ domain-containing protein [Desulfoluna spongiiphila]|uniref:PilZ domain-containing protein n=1 Tax=Desulfoluna spongiiphila TaxID=419481 RepID=A0A1G5FNN6_9BACT|nr:PilZ domain-containing protein [Desulfoluna spongiiphila]SCY40747.1 PilZ domain-containing protein [Desulfoluna spongiiphila]VVS95501.1 pilz domain [Desulfoluna spongiiphila]
MLDTILVKEDLQAFITCPSCHRVKEQDVSTFMGVECHVKIRCRCSCGHSFHVQLERRQFLRKDVSLPVVCKIEERGYRLSGTVTDLSQSGLRVRLVTSVPLEVGMRVDLSFHLDDRDHSLVEKFGTIRSISDLEVGMAFDSTQHYGKLGLYIEFH